MTTWQEEVIGRKVAPDKLDEPWRVSKGAGGVYEATLNQQSCHRMDVFLICTVQLQSDSTISGYHELASVECGHGRPTQDGLTRRECGQTKKAVASILAPANAHMSETVEAWHDRRMQEARERAAAVHAPPVMPLGMDRELFARDYLWLSTDAQHERQKYCKAHIREAERCSNGKSRQMHLQKAAHALLWMEFNIIRDEWCASVACVADVVFDRRRERENYVECRKRITGGSLSGEFAEKYTELKHSYNESARQYLDETEGRVERGLGIMRFTQYWFEGLRPCFVLPPFDNRGRHTAWSPRDVPWNSIETTRRQAHLAAAANERRRRGW